MVVATLHISREEIKNMSIHHTITSLTVHHFDIYNTQASNGLFNLKDRQA